MSSRRGNARPSERLCRVAGTDGAYADSWLKYEYQLCVDVPPTSFQTQLDQMMGSFGRTNSGVQETDVSNCEDEKSHDDSTGLRRKLESAFSNDRLAADPFSGDGFIADPYGVGDAMPPASDWIEWALNLAEKCPSERTEKIADELRDACELNEHVLDNLESETREGYSGSRAYVCALNYFLHDSFARCGLPLPPGMNLKVAIGLRGGEPLYKAQMRSWRGYKMRVFGILEMINECSAAHNRKRNSGDDDESSSSSGLPEILPPKKQRPMSAQVIGSLKRTESKQYPFESSSFGYDRHHRVDESEYYSSEGYGFDPYAENEFDQITFYQGREKDGFRGVHSYESGDDDDDSDEKFIGNLYRYPEGIQFYMNGGYDTSNKCHGGTKVEASRDGKEYESEAIPDIALRANEGNLAAVKRIVEAATAVSECEKVATVNKARVWIKLNYNETKFCELYDATPLAYACLGGHHDVVRYLLEQGADPTLRGTMPPSWSVNARGAVHKLYGKIERGDFSYKELGIMKKCSAQCEHLLFAARPFWKPSLYCGDSCHGNNRVTFSNAPTDICALQLALGAVPTIYELPPKRMCALCCRKKSSNCFAGQSSNCGRCNDIEKTTGYQPMAAQALATPRSFASGRRSEPEDEYTTKRICLLCCRKKTLHCFSGQSNECNKCSGIESDAEACDEAENEEYGQCEPSENICFDDEDQVDLIQDKTYDAESEEEAEYYADDDFAYCGDECQPDSSDDAAEDEEGGEYYDGDEFEYCEDEFQPDFSDDESYRDEDQLGRSDGEFECEDYSHGEEYDESSCGNSDQLEPSDHQIYDQSDCSEDENCSDRDSLLEHDEDDICEDSEEHSESKESHTEEETESGAELSPTTPRTCFFRRSSDTSGLVTSSPKSPPEFNGFTFTNSSAVGGASSSSFNIGTGDTTRTPNKSLFFFGRSSDTSGLVTSSPKSPPEFNGFTFTNSSAVGGASSSSFNIGTGDTKRTPDKSPVNIRILNGGNRRIVKARRPRGHL